MTYTTTHSYVDERRDISVSNNGGTATVRFSSSGSFSIRNPGKLLINVIAKYDVHIWVEDLGPHSQPGHGRWQAEHKSLPVTVEIKTPDGQPFTADHVTLEDIWRFRDLRGTSQGNWTYRVSGESAPIPIGPNDARVTATDGRVSIMLEETVPSLGAPLVSDTLASDVTHQYPIDLFHIGRFTAAARTRQLPFLRRGRPLKLIDPDGVVVASSTDGSLSFPVTLATIDKSRDANGGYRVWHLEVGAAPAIQGATPVRALVIATARVSTQVLQARINTMLGPGGSLVSIYGEMEGSDLVARLKVLDKVSAETIDMHGLLDSVIEWPDPKDKDFEADVVYTVARHTRDLDYEFHVSLNDMKITGIDVSIGQSEHIQPAIPAFRVRVGVAGDATIKLGGFPLARAKIRDNSIAMEAGIRLNPDGSFSPVAWVQDDRLDVDVSWEAAVAAGVISLGLLSLGAAGAAEYIEGVFNDAIDSKFTAALEGALGRAPRILELLMGGEFSYTSLRLEGDEIVFDYIAAPETNRRPYQDYVGIQGRSATQLGPHAWQIMPRTMGDTWSTANLARIDHIVVVMMENRSFDHVLGYRAQLPGAENADGLTPELMDFLGTQAYPVRKLHESGIHPNHFGFKTKFPASVGHGLADVTEQLSQRIAMPSGRSINSPAGFLSNFTTRAASHPELRVEDVLGYYEADDLPFFKHLAENYAYCEKFFCSHAGPTLPNRMLSLAGDVQYDRSGEAILDNNHGDNFILSRAQTIFDLLTRKGVSWRVYESPPSVTMLRMFARYAGDNSNILPVSLFAQHVAQNDLPAVTVIDPAMHHFPQNDDHPVADMYNGQVFLQGIYGALRSNPGLWHKTMLVITYDEHGGFYDHVIPPIAEARTRPLVLSDGGPSGPGPWTPATHLTAYGVRVPTFVVSPWTVPGKGPDIVLDHCSILKTIIARFCPDRPFLSDRVHASRTFDSYLSAPEPRLNVPLPPTLEPLPIEFQERRRFVTSQIDTEPMSRRKLRAGDTDSHELMGMLARLLGR